MSYPATNQTINAPVRATLTQERKNNQSKVITFLFNPTDYTIKKAVSYKPIPSMTRDAPITTFAGGGVRSLTLELLLDASQTKQGGLQADKARASTGSIEADVNSLFELAAIDPETQRQDVKQGRPPIVTFAWGNSTAFRSVITSLSVHYVLFNADGSPMRAKVQLSLDEVIDESLSQGQNPSSYSEAGFRHHRVAPGETLAYIAYQEYGSATEWRRLALANQLEDPLAIEEGQLLKAPPKP